MSVARPTGRCPNTRKFEDELRPFIEPLDAAGQHTFVDAYREPIVAAFPPRADGKALLRLRRLLIAARRG